MIGPSANSESSRAYAGLTELQPAPCVGRRPQLGTGVKEGRMPISKGRAKAGLRYHINLIYY